VITVVPGDIPKTIPVSEPTVATDVALLVHTPPGTLFVSVSNAPTHTPEEPVITPGAAVTVTVNVAKQVLGKV